MTHDEQLATIQMLVQHLERLRLETPKTASGRTCLQLSIQELAAELRHLWQVHAAA